MKTTLKTNIASLVGQRHTSRAGKEVEKSLTRLSSGQRVNSASDDAAGLSISLKQKSEINSSRKAVKNINDGISFVQTAEGALQEINNILVRMRELNVQGASDTNDDVGRANLDKEYQHLKKEIERITKTTKLNRKGLLDGSIQSFSVQADVHNASSSKLHFENTQHVSTLHALGIYDASTRTQITNLASLDKIDYAIGEVSRARAHWGALQKRMQSGVNNLETRILNTEESKSRVLDADVAHESSKMVKNKLMQETSINALGEANRSGERLLKLLG